MRTVLVVIAVTACSSAEPPLEAAYVKEHGRLLVNRQDMQTGRASIWIVDGSGGEQLVTDDGLSPS